MWKQVCFSLPPLPSHVKALRQNSELMETMNELNGSVGGKDATLVGRRHAFAPWYHKEPVRGINLMELCVSIALLDVSGQHQLCH